MMAPDVFSLDADSKVTRNTTTEETETHPLQVPRREPRGKVRKRALW